MFKQYIAQVMLNAKAMANALLKKGYTLVSGTECFLCVLFLHKTNKHIKSKLISFFFFTDYGIRFSIWSIIALLPLIVRDAIAFW